MLLMFFWLLSMPPSPTSKWRHASLPASHHALQEPTVAHRRSTSHTVHVSEVTKFLNERSANEWKCLQGSYFTCFSCSCRSNLHDDTQFVAIFHLPFSFQWKVRQFWAAMRSEWQNRRGIPEAPTWVRGSWMDSETSVFRKSLWRTEELRNAFTLLDGSQMERAWTISSLEHLFCVSAFYKNHRSHHPLMLESAHTTLLEILPTPVLVSLANR